MHWLVDSKLCRAFWCKQRHPTANGSKVMAHKTLCGFFSGPRGIYTECNLTSLSLPSYCRVLATAYSTGPAVTTRPWRVGRWPSIWRDELIVDCYAHVRTPYELRVRNPENKITTDSFIAISQDNPDKPAPECYRSGFHWSKDDESGGKGKGTYTCYSASE